MLHLLDSNCFITAHNQYYSLDRVPEYWEWILHYAARGEIKLPREIFDEICAGKGDLVDWMKAHQEVFVLDEVPDIVKVQHVLDVGYAPDLTEDEVEGLGSDPILIAYAFANAERSIVSKEVSKPAKRRANRKVPDVCDNLRVPRMDDFGLVRALNFRTNWNR